MGPNLSIIINIPGITIVNDFSLDHMHLVYLRVIRKK